MRFILISIIVVASLVFIVFDFNDVELDSNLDSSQPEAEKLQVATLADDALRVETDSNIVDLQVSTANASAAKPDDYWIRDGDWRRINPKYLWVNDPDLVDKVLAVLDEEYWKVKQALADQAGKSESFGPLHLKKILESTANQGDYKFDPNSFSAFSEYWEQEKLANILASVNSRVGHYGKFPLLAEDESSEYIREQLAKTPHEWPVEYMLSDIVGGKPPAMSPAQQSYLASIRDGFIASNLHELMDMEALQAATMSSLHRVGASLETYKPGDAFLIGTTGPLHMASYQDASAEYRFQIEQYLIQEGLL